MSLLATHELSVRLSRRDVIKAASLTLNKGELLGLVGPNGAGKSTLLRAILGLLPLSGGNVSMDNSDFHKLTTDIRSRRVAYLAQEAHCSLAIAGRTGCSAWTISTSGALARTGCRRSANH